MRKSVIRRFPQRALLAELKRRQRQAERLIQSRTKLCRRLAKLEREIAEITLNARGVVRRLPPASKTLAKMTAMVMSRHETIEVPDLLQAVQCAGYKTQGTMKSLQTSLLKALRDNPRAFKRVAWKTYRLR